MAKYRVPREQVFGCCSQVINNWQKHPKSGGFDKQNRRIGRHDYFLAGAAFLAGATTLTGAAVLAGAATLAGAAVLAGAATLTGAAFLTGAFAAARAQVRASRVSQLDSVGFTLSLLLLCL